MSLICITFCTNKYAHFAFQTHFKPFLSFLVLAAVLQCTRTDQCVASFPCVCIGTTIDCSRRHLTTVPHLTAHSNSTYRLILSGNPNLVITDESFASIAIDYLNLDNDVNISMSDHALRNQRTTLRELHIAQCDLDQVPEALRDLDALVDLYMWSNHIQHWDVNLMLKLSGTLNVLDLSDTALTSWPAWLSHMSNLVSLNLYKNDIDRFPHDAFYSSALTLDYLNIESSGVTEMPTAIASLKNLTILIVGGTMVNDVSFYYKWLPTRDSRLTQLSINNSSITKIPYGINDLSSLKILAIVGSRLRHVDEEAMPKGLMALLIVKSPLTQIHGGVCSPDLVYLRLQSSSIRSIEKHDLDDCHNLTYLSMDDNDIDYISPSALDGLAKLDSLRLGNNKLIHIPKTINSLKSLKFLYMDGNPLECTCQTLWFLKWRQSNPKVYINGQCTLLGIDLADFHSHCAQSFVG